MTARILRAHVLINKQALDSPRAKRSKRGEKGDFGRVRGARRAWEARGAREEGISFPSPGRLALERNGSKKEQALDQGLVLKCKLSEVNNVIL